MTKASPLSYAEALRIIEIKARATSSSAPAESVSLKESLGRIVARDLISGETFPTFANSAMDGFAVRSHETIAASLERPVRLKVVGHIAAGDAIPQSSREAAHAWEIMTGAPFPEDFDACVKVEDAEVVREGSQTFLLLRKPASAQQNRRQVGEDFQTGALLLAAGRRVRPEDILILASLGVTGVPVRSRPRVGIISTGRELVPIDEKPGPGKIRNSSKLFLEASMIARGCEVVHLGTVPDDAAVFRRIVEGIEPEAFDLILTTGAISKGAHDFVPEAWRELGGEFFFRKVAMRPGKPILFGRLPEGIHFLSLPGNPISSAVGIRFFVDPFLRAFQRSAPELGLRLPLDRKSRKTGGVTCFYKGHLVVKNGVSAVHLHDEQRPSLTYPLLSSDVWVLCEGAEDEIAEGAVVDVYPFLGGE